MSQTSTRHIPLAYSLLSAGSAIEVCDDYKLLDLNFLLTGGRDSFVAFIVTGDSMRPDIFPGNIVFVDTAAEPRTGDTVVVNVNGENCVKVLEHTARQLYLVPKNGEYPTLEVKPTDSFHILGVVKGHFAIY